MASGFAYPCPVCGTCQKAAAVSSPGMFMNRISNLNLENLLLKGLFSPKGGKNETESKPGKHNVLPFLGVTPSGFREVVLDKDVRNTIRKAAPQNEYHAWS